MFIVYIIFIDIFIFMTDTDTVEPEPEFDDLASKKINIMGTNNRYQIKKLTQEKQVHKRKNLENMNVKDYSHDLQKEIISTLATETSNKDFKQLFFLKEIKNKISSYKQQDITKKMLNEEEVVSLQYVIDLLNQCQLKCCYCSQNIYILYEHVRENMQWTLDRIDNKKGHNEGNVIIACLQCNLKRRCTAKDAFMFTKNMKIIKQDNEY